jgi:DNA mismatch repair protein MutS
VTVKEVGQKIIFLRKLKAGEHYVPNDVYLDKDQQQIIMITGPNMAGKGEITLITEAEVVGIEGGNSVEAVKIQHNTEGEIIRPTDHFHL